jgi:hypothetical protein
MRTSILQIIGSVIVASLAAIGVAQESTEDTSAADEAALAGEAEAAAAAPTVEAAAPAEAPKVEAAASKVPLPTPPSVPEATTTASPEAVAAPVEDGTADPEDAAAQTTEPDSSEVVKAESAAPTSAGDQPYDLISEGKRIELAEKGLSIVPPAGWQVQTSHPKLTLVMQVPFEKGMPYQRTIQVAGFVGPKYMDDLTAKEFEALIVREFSTALAAVQDFRVRNHMMVEMADGRDAILYYTEFKLEDVNLMQAHILVSSADRHFLMTFTDIAEHFENDEANEFLTEAWDAMTSVQLATPAPMRFENFIFIGVAVGVVALLIGAFWFFNYVRSGRKYMDYAAGKDLGDDPVSRHSGMTGMTGMTGLSGVSRLESKQPASDVQSIHSKHGKHGKQGKKPGKTAHSRQATDLGGETSSHTGTDGYKTAATSGAAPLTKDDDDLAV